MMGIYKIENNLDGKVYIGQSINITERISEHKRNAFNEEYVSYRYKIYKAIRKYGLENFTFSIIEQCSNQIELDEREIYWINYYDSYKNGYNETLGGKGNQHFSLEKINEIVALWEQGLSVGQICKKVNATNHTIIDYLKAYCSSYSVEEGDRRGRILNGIAHRKSVKCFDLEGNLINIYPSLKEAAAACGGTSSGIINCCKGVWKKHKGYRWEYNN